MAETVASSGIVQGHVESTIGPQTQGLVTRLLVEEGSSVQRGQLLATVQNNVALEQVDQAREQLATAEALLTQVSEPPQASEISSANARIRQARSYLTQQDAAVSAASNAKLQAHANVKQAQVGVSRAEALVAQAEARLGLAGKTLARKSSLAKAGAIPLTDLDSAQAAYDIAVQEVANAKEGVAQAKLAVEGSRSVVSSSDDQMHAAAAMAASARAQIAAAESDLRTLLSRPRSVDVQVARRRVSEASAALNSAIVQAKNTDIRAPFAGTVTEILAQAGSSPAQGLLKLVGTTNLEIRLDLDEANLRSVHVGQQAVISLPNSEQQASGHVRRIASQIDAQRGTLEVFVVTDKPQSWLRPGQTLNVNVVTNPSIRRLLVPAASIKRSGDTTEVFVVREGRAVAVAVKLGLTAKNEIVVLEGLRSDDKVISDSASVSAGQKVSLK